MRNRLRSRRIRLVAAVAGTIVLVAATWALVQRQRSGGPPAVNRLAVLPFAVHGNPQLAYMSEGIVDLLSRNLEGADDIQCIDPGTIMSALRRHPNATQVDLETGRALVRRFGGGAFIVGSINSVGSRLRIQAALHDASDQGGSSLRAAVEGDSTQLLALVDRLAAELLVKRRPGAAHRLTQTAALTTSSLPALKAFLNAERDLRGGRLDSAVAGYQRAIAEDSAFTLAQYRLAVAAGWHERHALSSQAAIKAVSVGGYLTQRDRRLMTAYAAFRQGAPNEAESQFRAVLEDFPDDLEAEFQLGDLLYQYNPLRGRPRLEARPMLDRTLAHDPGFL